MEKQKYIKNTTDAIKNIALHYERTKNNKSISATRWNYLLDYYVIDHPDITLNCNDQKRKFNIKEQSLLKDYIVGVRESMKFVTASCRVEIANKFKKLYMYIKENPIEFGDCINYDEAKMAEFIKEIQKSAKIISNPDVSDAEALQVTNYVINGDIGIGKTTFLNNAFSTNCEMFDKNKCIWIRLDFNKPINSSVIEDVKKDNSEIPFLQRIYLHMFKILKEHYSSKILGEKDQLIEVDFSNLCSSDNVFSQKLREKIIEVSKLKSSQVSQHFKIIDNYIYEGSTRFDIIDPLFAYYFIKAMMRLNIHFVFIIDGLDRINLSEFKYEDLINFYRRAYSTFLSYEHQRIGVKIHTFRNETFVLANRTGIFPKGIEPSFKLLKSPQLDTVLQYRLEEFIKEKEKGLSQEKVELYAANLILIINSMLKRSFSNSSVIKKGEVNYINAIAVIFNFNYRKALKALNDILIYLFIIIDNYYKADKPLQFIDILQLATSEDIVSKHYKIFDIFVKGDKLIHRNKYIYSMPNAPTRTNTTSYYFDNVFYIPDYFNTYNIYDPLLIIFTLDFLNENHVLLKEDILNFLEEYFKTFHADTDYNSQFAEDIIDIIIDFEFVGFNSISSTMHLKAKGKFILQEAFNIDYIENLAESLPFPSEFIEDILLPCATLSKNVSRRIKITIYFLGILKGIINCKQKSEGVSGHIDKSIRNIKNQLDKAISINSDTIAGIREETNQADLRHDIDYIIVEANKL